jgi:3-deoxy-D-arabino-heptulosonate 7-phosphate (DAHP) synthase class II
LTLVQRNEAFLLHAGDCAESFEACTQVRSTVIASFNLPRVPHRADDNSHYRKTLLQK